MEKIAWYEHVELLDQALSGNGAFLVARDEFGKANPMTIGWGAVGRIWSIPTFTVLVRRSRYTHSCIKQEESFTVSVPKNGDLAAALDFCGRHSGRETDKAAACGIAFRPGTRVATPVIDGCALYYECRIILRKQLDEGDFSAPDVLEKYYDNDNHHMIVIGEIVAAYIDPTRA